MKEIKAYYKILKGSNYEIGTQLARWMLLTPEKMQFAVMPPNVYPQNKLKEIEELLDVYGPGINDEIQGFADTIGIPKGQVLFYAMTYLERGCSMMAAIPRKSTEGHTILARNYDFSDSYDDLCLATTEIVGKYKHIGSLVNLFGRCDGMNECGLAVAQASNGMPVGNFEGGQKPGCTGLQFWIIIRNILENCKDVNEAIEYANRAPIGYNINLIIADKSGTIGLFESLNGQKAHKILNQNSTEDYISVTNHTVLEQLKHFEPIMIENSLIRNQSIENVFNSKHLISKDDIKELLTESYPKGLCCHYYEDYFGTLRSMVFDVTDLTLEMTFGTPQMNDWYTFNLDNVRDKEFSMKIPYEKVTKDFYNIVPRF